MALLNVPKTAAEVAALHKILQGMEAFIEESRKALDGQHTKPVLAVVPGKAKRTSKPRGKLSPVEGGGRKHPQSGHVE